MFDLINQDEALAGSLRAETGTRSFRRLEAAALRCSEVFHGRRIFSVLSGSESGNRLRLLFSTQAHSSPFSSQHKSRVLVDPTGELTAQCERAETECGS